MNFEMKLNLQSIVTLRSQAIIMTIISVYFVYESYLSDHFTPNVNALTRVVWVYGNNIRTHNIISTTLWWLRAAFVVFATPAKIL